MAKYLIEMSFLDTGRIGSPAGFDFFPIFPCPAGKARGKAKAIHAEPAPPGRGRRDVDLCPPPRRPMAALRHPADLTRPAKTEGGLREIRSCEEATATDRRNFYCIFGGNPHSAALDSWVRRVWVYSGSGFWGSNCHALSSSWFWPPPCRRCCRRRQRVRPLPRSSRRSLPSFWGHRLSPEPKHARRTLTPSTPPPQRARSTRRPRLTRSPAGSISES